MRSSAVVGGIRNTASGNHASIGGGGCNVASGDTAVIAGGGQNNVDTLVCAFGNVATGAYSAIGGGSNNSASGGNSTIAGGAVNIASGSDSTVPGGVNNTAGGSSSFAAGYRAKALAQGSIVFGDRTEFDVTSNVPNQFIVAASGGIIMATNKNLSTGCFMIAGGGTWNCTSDRNAKRDFTDIAVQAILDKVTTLPLSMWRYEGEASGVQHIGPTAQDFRAAFGLGHDERTIALVDADGVALAAIQGLHQRMQETMRKKDEELGMLRYEMAELRRAVQLMLARAPAE
jgi:hypothetical protein